MGYGKAQKGREEVGRKGKEDEFEPCPSDIETKGKEMKVCHI